MAQGNAATFNPAYRNKQTSKIQKDEEELAQLEKEWEESQTKAKESEAEEQRKFREELQEEAQEEPEQETDGVSPEDKEEKETKKQEVKDEEEEEEDSKLSAEDKTYKKRYGDLRRHMQQKEKDWESKLEALKNKVEKGEPLATKEGIQKWIKDNSEVAAIIESIAEAKAEERFKGAEDRLKHLDEEAFALRREKAEDKIRKKHSDFDELREDDAFHSWAGEQPNWIKTALYDDPEDYASVIRVIDLYKADKGQTKAAKTKEKDAIAPVGKGKSSAPKGETKIKWTDSRVAALTLDEYEKFEAEIDEAKSAGNYGYGV